MRRWSVREREDAEAWRWAVLGRSNGLCVVSGEPATCAHHAVTQQVLRRRARDLGVDPAWLLWDARNGVGVCEEVHRRHHSAHTRIPRSALPACVFEFAETYGLERYIDRYYAEEVAA